MLNVILLMICLFALFCSKRTSHCHLGFHTVAVHSDHWCWWPIFFIYLLLFITFDLAWMSSFWDYVIIYLFNLSPSSFFFLFFRGFWSSLFLFFLVISLMRYKPVSIFHYDRSLSLKSKSTPFSNEYLLMIHPVYSTHSFPFPFLYHFFTYPRLSLTPSVFPMPCLFSLFFFHAKISKWLLYIYTRKKIRGGRNPLNIHFPFLCTFSYPPPSLSIFPCFSVFLFNVFF